MPQIGSFTLLLALALSVYFSRKYAASRGLQFWSPAARYVLEALAIPLVAGGLFCALLAGGEGYPWIVPAMLLFYGTALTSAGRYTVSEVRYLGLAELVVGLAAAGWPSFGLAFWAFGFGVLHILYGAFAYRKYEM